MATSYRVQLLAGSTIIKDTTAIRDTFCQLANLSQSTVYTWKVAGINQVGSTWSTTWTFTTVFPIPVAPTLLYPPDAAGNISIEPILKWSKVIYATGYLLQVANNAAFTTPAYNQSSPDTFRTVSLQKDKTYYWRVQSQGVSGNSAWSTVQTFMTVQEVPAAPIPLRPTNMPPYPKVPLKDTIVWTKVFNATSYDVMYWTKRDTSDVIRFSTSDTSYPVTFTQDYTQYSWRVRTVNTAGPGAWSTTAIFLTEFVMLTVKPTLLEPANKVINLPNPVVFKWTKVSGALRYNLEYTTTTFATGYTQVVVTDTVSDGQTLTAAKVYYWRVQAVNGTMSGPWSVVDTLSTLVAKPNALVVLSPFGIVRTDSVFFRWMKGTPQVTGYWLEFSTDSNFNTSVIDSGLTDTTKLVRMVNNTYWWRVKACNLSGWGPFNTFKFVVNKPSVSTITRSVRVMRTELVPMNGGLMYTLAGRGKLTVYRMDGRILSSEVRDSGTYKVHLPHEIVIVTLESESENVVLTKKLTLL